MRYAHAICDQSEILREKPHNRIFGVDVFRKIQESIGLDFVNFYDPVYFMTLLEECGFKTAVRFTMDLVQFERTGQKAPFDFDEPGWITMVKN
jgi:hypothetical protein